jgi:hypothetical protein
MAARRLIIIMFVLLAISTFAAALAPVQEPATPPIRETTAPAPGPAAGASRLIHARLDADAPKPGVVRAEPGDRLELLVASKQPREISIDRLGLIANAAPGAPARFDTLLGEPGSLPVTVLGGASIGRVAVERAERRSGKGREDRGPEE